MRTVCAILVATVLTGCATTEAWRAQTHETRALQLEQDGRYDAALHEREAADDAREFAGRKIAEDSALPRLTPFR